MDELGLQIVQIQAGHDEAKRCKVEVGHQRAQPVQGHGTTDCREVVGSAVEHPQEAGVGVPGEVTGQAVALDAVVTNGPHSA